MKTLNLLVLILFVLTFFSCNNSSNNKTIYTKENTITFDCFCDSLISKKGKPLVCEPSAIVFFKDTAYIANDKDMPNSAAVFKTSYNNGLDIKNLQFLDDSLLIQGTKFEDFTISPDNKFIFLTTGFDRIRPDNSEWDKYNCLYYWSTKDFHKINLFTEAGDTLTKSSKHLRRLFENIIDTVKYKGGVPYFKIEGLASIPGDTLLFAVREYGKSYEDFTYSMKIIAVPYKINNEEITLKNNAKLIFDYNPNHNKIDGVNITIGISSIEYNKYDKNLYILTSYEFGENSEDVGAYLWKISLYKLKNNKKPTLVYDQNNKPLHFAHKAEGVAVVDSTTLLIIHDDDRVYGPEKITDSENQFKRKHHQAAYTILHKN